MRIVSSVKCDENIKMIAQIGTPRLHIGNHILLISIVIDSYQQYSKCWLKAIEDAVLENSVFEVELNCQQKSNSNHIWKFSQKCNEKSKTWRDIFAKINPDRVIKLTVWISSILLWTLILNS